MCITGNGLKTIEVMKDQFAATPVINAKLDEFDQVVSQISETATAEQAARQSICGSLGYSFWAINKVPWPGDTADPLAPIEELKLGKSYVLTMKNVTPLWSRLATMRPSRSS